MNDDEAALGLCFSLRNWAREPLRPYDLRVGIIGYSSLDEAHDLGADGDGCRWRQLFLEMAGRDVVARLVMG
jgi:hypothetical protein